jgi:hypothetical protein
LGSNSNPVLPPANTPDTCDGGLTKSRDYSTGRRKSSRLLPAAFIPPRKHSIPIRCWRSDRELTYNPNSVSFAGSIPKLRTEISPLEPTKEQKLFSKNADRSFSLGEIAIV